MDETNRPGFEEEEPYNLPLDLTLGKASALFIIVQAGVESLAIQRETLVEESIKNEELDGESVKESLEIAQNLIASGRNIMQELKQIVLELDVEEDKPSAIITP